MSRKVVHVSVSRSRSLIAQNDITCSRISTGKILKNSETKFHEIYWISSENFDSLPSTPRKGCLERRTLMTNVFPNVFFLNLLTEKHFYDKQWRMDLLWNKRTHTDKRVESRKNHERPHESRFEKIVSKMQWNRKFCFFGRQPESSEVKKLSWTIFELMWIGQTWM